jgi:hypothetical protein
MVQGLHPAAVDNVTLRRAGDDSRARVGRADQAAEVAAAGVFDVLLEPDEPDDDESLLEPDEPDDDESPLEPDEPDAEEPGRRTPCRVA